MIDQKTMSYIMDSLIEPVLFADTKHITRYMNKAAIEYYDDGIKLIDKNLLDCHNQKSQQMMVEILAEMHKGLDEKIITDNKKYRIYMRAVRDGDGLVIGYFERYEPPQIKKIFSATDNE